MEQANRDLSIFADTLRARITNRLVPLLFAGLSLNAFFSLLRISTLGFQPFFALHIILVLLSASLYMVRKRIKPDTSALLMVGLLFLLLFSGITAFGLLSAAFVLGPIIPLYLILLGYRRSAFLSIAIILSFMLLMAHLFAGGDLVYIANPASYVRSYVAWLVMVTAVGGVSFAFVLSFESVPQALEGSEERFRLAFENANVGVCITKLDGSLLKVNSALCSMLGYSRDELEQLNVSEITFKDDLNSSMEFIRRASTGGAPMITLEKRYVRKNGAVIWADVSSSLIFDSHQRPQNFITHIQDITERKRAQDNLRASEARYRALIENTPDIIATFDRDGKYLFVNSSIAKVSNIAPDEFKGKNMREVGFSNEQTQFREKAIRGVFETQIPFESEFEFEGVAGKAVFDWRVYPVLNEHNKVISVFSISANITQRKMAESALRRSEEKFHKIFHASPAPMSISTLTEGVYLDVNESFLKAMEFQRDEIIGKSAIELNTWADEIERKQAVDILFNNGSLRDFEAKHRTKTGRIGNSVASAEIIDLGGTRCILAVTLDITERKHAEEILKYSVEQLHDLTLRLENIQEEERKSISREVHDELGQVLTALKMDIMSLKRSGATDAKMVQEKLQSMLDLTAGATKTVQTISARLRPGMLDDLGLVAAIEWLSEDFQKRSGIACKASLPSYDFAVDSQRSTAIFRILQETLTNVMRHAQANHVTIDLSESSDAIVLVVKDDGVGISDVQINNPGSYGLLGIRERLHPYTGICIIQRGANGGTEVSIKIPKRSSSPILP